MTLQVSQQTQRALTLSEKFQRCKRVGQQLIALACEGGTDVFHARFAALQRLLSLWETGATAVISSAEHTDADDILHDNMHARLEKLLTIYSDIMFLINNLPWHT